MARHVDRARGPAGSRCAGAACAIVLLSACSHDWDDYDPRPGDPGSAASSASGGGQGAAGASGPTSAGGAGNGGGEAAGGSGGSGGLPPPPCGGTSLLGDDFEDSVATGYFFATPAGGTVVGGEAVVHLTDDGSQQWRSFDTWRMHDFRNDQVAIAVTQMVDVATTAFAFLDVGYDDNHVRLFQQNGFLGFATELDGTWDESGVAFDPTEHAFWRIRETEGTVYWETSADGVSWHIGRAEPTRALFPVDLVAASFGAGADGGEVAPGEARFDHLDGGSPVGAWCKASSLVDDFDDPERAPVWRYSYEETGCTVAESDGEMVVVVSDGVEAYCGYFSATAFELADDSLGIAVPDTLDPATNAEAYFGVYNRDADWAGLVANGGLLYAQQRIDGGPFTNIASVAYDQADHRFWRLRDNGGVLTFETSPDGMAWTVLIGVPTPFDLSMVDIDFGAGAYQPETNPGAAHFDDLGLP